MILKHLHYGHDAVSILIYILSGENWHSLTDEPNIHEILVNALRSIDFSDADWNATMHGLLYIL